MLRTGIFYLLAFSILVLTSCKNEGRENSYSSESAVPAQEELAKGFHLLENNCFSCHSPNPTTELKTGPTIAAIKTAYVQGKVSSTQFTNDMVAFLNNPNIEGSKMPEAINQFNLMPKMSLSDEQISQISAYLYYTEIENPAWFAKSYESEKEKYSKAEPLPPIEAGQAIALKTKGVLGKNLLGALNSQGTEEALAFCSTKAIPLTDSMSLALNAGIKRVSDKNRNPDNKASTAELAYIAATKERIARDEKPKPQLNSEGDKHIGYYPIMTNNMCLQCHGQTEKDIPAGTLAKINELYPNDLATGYSLNELRGIWVVEMDKK